MGILIFTGEITQLNSHLRRWAEEIGIDVWNWV
jgi:hypothetical protein